MKTPQGFKIGADPEFEFRRNGEIVRASTVFGTHDTQAHLGTDGASSTAELRVNAGSYYEIIQEVARLIGQAKKVSGCEAYAGSGTSVPLGGHIHFSGIPTDVRFINQLEKFITRPLNTVSNRRARSRHGYGTRAGEIRQQPHGWEFRSPLSWLSTPVMTNGTLAIAWVLARAFKNGHIETITNQADLLNYCYKRERIAINLFYETIKQYKRDGVQLENIEMFQAWGKQSKRTPSILPRFSSDDFMEHILRLTAIHTNRYNPFACYTPLYFFGIRRSRESRAVVHVPRRYEWLANVQHLGAEIVVSDDCSNPYMSSNRFGLSYKLREKDNGRAALWTIKRITKAINDNVETSAR